MTRMPFFKTSVAVTRAQKTTPPGTRVGEEREGKVWDGNEWVSKEHWEATRRSSKLPGDAD